MFAKIKVNIKLFFSCGKIIAMFLNKTKKKKM